MLCREKESLWLVLSLLVACHQQIDYLSDGKVSVICNKREKNWMLFENQGLTAFLLIYMEYPSKINSTNENNCKVLYSPQFGILLPPPPLPTQIQNTHHNLALNDLFFRFMLLDLLQSLDPLVLVVYHLVSQSRDFKSLYSDLFFECFILCREV